MTTISDKVVKTVLMGSLLLTGAENGMAKSNASSQILPTGFVYLNEIDASIQQDLKYAGSDNFIGEPITGYEGHRVILTRQAAEALAKVQHDLQHEGLNLLVFDGYRPQRAVNHFVRWSQNPYDQRNKQQFYPHIDKKDVFKLDYVMERSGHSRGSTVDLTMVDAKTGVALDMGTAFDFMDPLSHPTNRDVTPLQYVHRQRLREAMAKHGFEGIKTEWWHFTLTDEPFKETYFDFVVRES